MVSARAGLDVLASRRPGLLRGRRVGLLCHPASVTRGLDHAVDVIARLRGATLVPLCGPYHGLVGAVQDHARVGSTRDPSTRLVVWSLYDRRLAPSDAMLRGIEVLVVDLQDVGARYYTFVWTM